ncbi:MAG: transposase [Oligoflexales bacterium]|nr:transposase [Oligoflexales bacterium]
MLIEKLDSGDFKYYISNLSESTPIEKLVYLAKSRWKIEQGYQQLKEELGVDHYEGRTWSGLHHHIALCFMAFHFLNELRSVKAKITQVTGKKIQHK